MNTKKSILMTMSLAMMAAADESLFAGSRLMDNSKPYPKKKSLSCWDICGHPIYAKDEKTAIKYAKKRGLYTDSQGRD